MKLFKTVATISAVSACGYYNPPPPLPPIDWAAVARALEVLEFL